MVVVVPVDSNIRKTQHIGEERDPCGVKEHTQGVPIWHFKRQHHNRDDNRKDTVTERFETRSWHTKILMRYAFGDTCHIRANNDLVCTSQAAHNLHNLRRTTTKEGLPETSGNPSPHGAFQRDLGQVLLCGV